MDLLPAAVSEGLPRVGIVRTIPVMAQTAAFPATILVVEDRPEVLEVVRRTLASNGYTVRTAEDGEAGLNLALDLRPDLVILDIGLPKRSGLHVARELRNRAYRGPVLMLTALDTVSDKVVGFDAGADDYLAKPFDYEELLARVKALLRRSTIRADDTVMKVDDLTLSPLTREVMRAGELIPLTAKEYALLEYLMRNQGRILTREQITDEVWKADVDGSSNVVDVYISYLRQKIDTPNRTPLLHTIRKTGYCLSTERPSRKGDRASSEPE
jgi:DNA-binding response OmpR family regulator